MDKVAVVREGKEQGSFFLDFSFPIMGEEDN
jgi:hypothetical protein